MDLDIIETNFIVLNETINNIIGTLNLYENVDINPISTEINYTLPKIFENPSKAALKIIKFDFEFFKGKYEELSEKSNNLTTKVLKSSFLPARRCQHGGPDRGRRR